MVPLLVPVEKTQICELHSNNNKRKDIVINIMLVKVKELLQFILYDSKVCFSVVQEFHDCNNVIRLITF